MSESLRRPVRIPVLCHRTRYATRSARADPCTATFMGALGGWFVRRDALDEWDMNSDYYFQAYPEENDDEEE